MTTYHSNYSAKISSIDYSEAEKRRSKILSILKNAEVNF